MTASGIMWCLFYAAWHQNDSEWSSLFGALAIAIPTSWLRIWLVQFIEYNQWYSLHGKGIDQLHLWFGVFSISLAVAIQFSIPLLKREALKSQLVIFENVMLVLIGGNVAKRAVWMFSATKLKVFFATWVLVLGVSGLPLS